MSLTCLTGSGRPEGIKDINRGYINANEWNRELSIEYRSTTRRTTL